MGISLGNAMRSTAVAGFLLAASGSVIAGDVKPGDHGLIETMTPEQAELNLNRLPDGEKDGNYAKNLKSYLNALNGNILPEDYGLPESMTPEQAKLNVGRLPSGSEDSDYANNLVSYLKAINAVNGVEGGGDAPLNLDTVSTLDRTFQETQKALIPQPVVSGNSINVTGSNYGVEVKMEGGNYLVTVYKEKDKKGAMVTYKVINSGNTSLNFTAGIGSEDVYSLFQNKNIKSEVEVEAFGVELKKFFVNESSLSVELQYYKVNGEPAETFETGRDMFESSVEGGSQKALKLSYQSAPNNLGQFGLSVNGSDVNGYTDVTGGINHTYITPSGNGQFKSFFGSDWSRSIKASQKFGKSGVSASLGHEVDGYGKEDNRATLDYTYNFGAKNQKFTYDTAKYNRIGHSVDPRNVDSTLTGMTIKKIGFINNDPTNITCTPCSVDENSPLGTIVGTLDSHDADGDTVTYSLASNSTPFEILGNQIITKEVFDFEAGVPGYNLSITARDGKGGITTINVYVGIKDVIETTPVDTQAPVITLTGGSTVSMEQGSTYNELGASCVDNKDATCSVVITGTVNTNVVGPNTITYTATDAEGNISVKTRTVNVTPEVDREVPVITLNGESLITHEAGTRYSDLGAVSFDAVDGRKNIIATSGTVDITRLGDNTLTFTDQDNAGNSATPVTRTVGVVDTTPATITVNGPANQTHILGTPYVDQGATTSDYIDGSGIASVSGIVNHLVLGLYTVNYGYTDVAGNVSGTKQRVVEVVCPTDLVELPGTEGTACSSPL